LLVKATPTELQLVQDILASIDKNKNEVVLDVDIFEVSRDSMLQIGNQLASDKGVPQQAFREQIETDKDGNKKITIVPDTNKRGVSASLLNRGGFGNKFAPLAGIVASPSILGFGGLIGLPTTSLSLLQSKGNSKLLYKTQIHVLDGGQN